MRIIPISCKINGIELNVVEVELSHELTIDKVLNYANVKFKIKNLRMENGALELETERELPRATGFGS